MSDIEREYNRALAAAKVRALEVLKELLLTCTDPVEARRIARAILEARTPAERKAAKAAQAAAQPPAQPAPPAPKPVAIALNPHALGTLNLDSQSLPIHTGPINAPMSSPLGSLPITLTPSSEPQMGGGPASTRPLPLPLGPPRA